MTNGPRVDVPVRVDGFVDRHGLACQERLVGLQVNRFDKDCVGGYTIALAKNYQVTAHDVSSGNPTANALPNDKRARRGEIAQSLKNVFGACLLYDSDGYGKGCECQQDESFGEVSQQKVSNAADQEQGKHRLAQDIHDDAQQRCLPGARNLVGTVLRSPRLGREVRQACRLKDAYRGHVSSVERDRSE
jgi:hypothetical protein